MDPLRLLRVAATVVLFALVAGCATPPRHPALAAAVDAAPLLPARAFYANREQSGRHRVSPDGRWLAWIAAHGVQSALWVRPLTPGGIERVAFMGVSGPFEWAADSRHVLALGDFRGDENTHVIAIDTAGTGRVRDLTPGRGVRAWTVFQPGGRTDDVLVRHNRRDGVAFDLYRVRIATGEQTLLERDDGSLREIAVDGDGRVVARLRRAAGGVALHAGGESAAPALLLGGHEDVVSLLSADADGSGAYLLTDAGRERQALVRVDLRTGASQVLHEDSSVDVQSVVLDPRTGRPLAVYTFPDHRRMTVLDAGVAADLARGAPADARQIALTGPSMDLRWMLMVVDHNRQRRTLLWDRSEGRLEPLGNDPFADLAVAFGERLPISLRARDGFLLHGYLTLPPGVAAGPRPLVLRVHGGPWIRDVWDDALDARFLASRGYAVLQVNFRGSTGYGRAFREAAVGEFAGRMHDDLLDAVDWAVSGGIADRDKVAILGNSYGGYAALVGLTFTPDRFACGISIAGPSDLVSLIERAPRYWQADIGIWHRFVGDPSVPVQRERMAARSPIGRLDALRVPLLMIHGDRDVRVPLDQAERFVAPARERGKTVELLTLRDQGHVLGGWQAQLRIARATERFLAGCLGGADGGFDVYELGARWL